MAFRSLCSIIVCSCLLMGCATVNFSANYYTLPDSYQLEIINLWQKLSVQYQLPAEYKITMIDGADDKKANGVPFISNTVIVLPKTFIKYVYQNYYDDRFIILTSIITHELCHSLYHLPGTPPEEHFKVDLRAIQLMGTNLETVENFYKSLVVVKSYWFARKGMAGHALNVGFNSLSVASMVFGGPTYFADLYATDLDKRLKWLAQHYQLKSGSFPRSSQKK